MSKTNHNRNFKAKKFKSDGSFRRLSYLTFSGGVVCLDGELVTACASIASENKHMIAKSRRGAKKFINSRRKRHDRDFIKVEYGV